MLRELKTFIGIQALDLEVHFGQQDKSNSVLPVTLKWNTKEVRTITQINLVLKEEYTRGRWTRKHKQTLQLGQCTLNGPWHVKPDLPVVFNTEVPYDLASSPLDRLKKKLIFRPIALSLGWIENVQSHFYLEITTTIKGAALPTVRRIDLPELGIV